MTSASLSDFASFMVRSIIETKACTIRYNSRFFWLLSASKTEYSFGHWSKMTLKLSLYLLTKFSRVPLVSDQCYIIPIVLQKLILFVQWLTHQNSFQNIRQVRLGFANLLVLHSIGQTYLSLYFLTIISYVRIAELVRAPVWSWVQIWLTATGNFVIFYYVPFPLNSVFPAFPKEFSHFLQTGGSHS